MLTRRRFLSETGLAAAGLAFRPSLQDQRLAPTESNIEGPFYRKEAPFRSNLAEGLKGDPLKISGKVRGVDGTPLAGAVVDVWQADKAGQYDNESPKFVLRGRLRADKNGLYVYETIMPGQYDLGESKRPAHIHYKVSADGFKLLTTQLYFKGDPYLERDPFVRKSLVIELEKSAGTFDIVLAKA
jgi:catechol 1,2-dioxygenase